MFYLCSKIPRKHRFRESFALLIVTNIIDKKEEISLLSTAFWKGEILDCKTDVFFANALERSSIQEQRKNIQVPDGG